VKRILFFVFFLCLLLASAMITAYADDSGNEVVTENEILDSGQCGESLYWELNSEGLLRIFGTGPMYDYNKYYEPSPWYKYRNEPYISDDGTVILDSNGDTYLSTEAYYANNPNGYKVKDILIEDGVTYIGDWAFYRVCVEEITVPETVEATGIFCFRYSPTLRKLTLPDSLRVLDDYAISRNYELEVVDIGNSLEIVGTAGFNNNPSLKEIILPDTCTTINKQLSPAYASIDYSKVGLMENCSALEVVSFGKVTEIPQRTCLGAALKSVVIPNTVKSIGDYAFYSCSSLDEVIFEENSICTEIKNTAFSSCSSLERVKGGVSLKKLGLYTSLTSLSEFDFSSSNTELLGRQFLGTSLKEVRVSENISVIPVACFNSMGCLEKIYLPQTLTEIMASSFNYCESLKDIYFGGTQAQWWSIKKASGWSYKVNPECMLHFSDGTSVSLWYTPKKYTVTFLDFDGTVISTQQVIEGTLATEPESPVREGYKFIGWDKEFTSVTEDIVITAEYSIIPKPIATGKLRVNVNGGAGFKISVNDGNIRPQGSIYVNTKMPIGVTVTVVADEVVGVNFIGWMDEYGVILSLTDTYTFTTSGNDYIQAAYQMDIQGVNAVIFKNSKSSGGKGQIIDMQYYTAGDEIVFPDAPSQTGYDFIGWSMTEAEIQEELETFKDVTVIANWKLAQVYIDVTVSGGTISTAAQENGKYIAYNAVTVIANSAPEGQKFAYWTDADGNIVSYDETYKSYPSASVKFTAVYVAENMAIEKKPLVFISLDPTTDGEKITCTMYWDVDESIGTVITVGMLITDKTDYNADTFFHNSGDSKLFDRTLSSTHVKQKNVYSINKADCFYDQTYCAVMFVIYTDSKTGEPITVYSDMVESYKLKP